MIDRMTVQSHYDRKGRLHLEGVTAAETSTLTSTFRDDVEAVTIRPTEDRDAYDVVVRLKPSLSAVARTAAALNILAHAHGVPMKNLVTSPDNYS